MKISNVLLVSLIWLSQTSIYAKSNEECTFRNFKYAAKTGFMLGYVTGIIPVAGQIIFPIMIGFASDDPEAKFGTFAASALLGHFAGLATIFAAVRHAGRIVCSRMPCS